MAKRRRKKRRYLPNYGSQIARIGLGTAGALIGLSVAGAVSKRFS